jgi:hypothetical protein
LGASEALVRRAVDAWVTRQLTEEERSRIQRLSAFAAHESTMERAARVQIALALQDSARQAYCMHAAHQRAVDTAYRRRQHAAVVALEEAERAARVAQHRAAAEEIAALRVAARTEAAAARESLSMDLATERDMMAADEAIERAEEGDAARKREERHRAELVGEVRSAKVATLMHRHHGRTEAARARAEALADIEAAQAAARDESKQHSLMQQAMATDAQDSVRRAIAAQHADASVEDRAHRQSMMAVAAQATAAALDEHHEVKQEVAQVHKRESVVRRQSAVALQLSAGAASAHALMVAEAADRSERERRRIQVLLRGR